MKNLFLLGLVIVLFTACENQQTRYTQNSPEIDTFKKAMNDYKKMNWANLTTHYADTAKIANNVIEENALTISQVIEKNKEDADMLTWVVEKEEYEMVVTDKDETWVNFWGLWKGTMKSNDKLYNIPFHSTARFINGQIVEEYGYWNNSEIVADILATEKEMAAATIDTIIN